MSHFTLFIAGAAVAVGLAIFWLAYLIKLVINDEEVRERIRTIIRQREEQKRQLEEQRQRRILAKGGEIPAPPSSPTPQDAINALSAAADRGERRKAEEKSEKK